MTQPNIPNPINQNAQNVGQNAIQVGGDYTDSKTTNINLLISVFFISVLALGGLAWALSVGPLQGGLSPQTEEVQPQPTLPPEE